MKPTRSTTPLGLLAVFVGATEAGLGIAVAGTTGQIQAALVWFMCVFAAACFITFVVLLVCKAHVLYPPSEFGGGGATFEEFAQKKPEGPDQQPRSQSSALSSTTSMEDRICNYLRNLEWSVSIWDLAKQFASDADRMTFALAIKSLLDSGRIVRMLEDQDLEDTQVGRIYVVHPDSEAEVRAFVARQEEKGVG